MVHSHRPNIRFIAVGLIQVECVAREDSEQSINEDFTGRSQRRLTIPKSMLLHERSGWCSSTQEKDQSLHVYDTFIQSLLRMTYHCLAPIKDRWIKYVRDVVHDGWICSSCWEGYPNMVLEFSFSLNKRICE